jgi:hypothetical protein
VVTRCQVKCEYILCVDRNRLDRPSVIPREYGSIVKCKAACAADIELNVDTLRSMLGADETVFAAWNVVRSQDEYVVYHAIIIGYAPFDCPRLTLNLFVPWNPVTSKGDSMSSPTKFNFTFDMQTEHRLSIPAGPLSVSKDSDDERAFLRVALRHVRVDIVTSSLWKVSLVHLIETSL